MKTYLNKIVGIAGLLLGLAAIAVNATYPSKVAATALLAGAGAVLLAVFFIMHFEIFKGFSQKRSAHAKMNAALMVVLLLFIVVLLNLIARQYYFRIDRSTDSKFSLAPQSRAATGLVSGEVQLLFFGGEGSKEYTRAEALLEAYRHLNKNIVYELLDLDKVPLKAKEFGVTEYNTLVARAGEKTVMGKGADEQNITNLIIQATRKKVLIVRFLQGHDERPMDERGRAGYGVALKNLTDLGYTVEPLVLPQAGGVPPDTDLLIIAAPRTELSTVELQMLEKYSDRGGKFFVLIDSPDQAKGLMDYFHLKVSQFPVYDTQNVAGTDPSVPLVTKYYEKPITKDFGLSTLFPGVHEVLLDDSGSDYAFDFIIRSSRNSWFEKNGNGKMDEDEKDGFNVIAGMLRHKQKLMKAVIFGDSDFATNAYIASGGNANLFANVSTWLLGEGALTTVAPSKRPFVPMFVTEGQSGLVRTISAVGLPVCIFLAGVYVWYRRRGL